MLEYGIDNFSALGELCSGLDFQGLHNWEKGITMVTKKEKTKVFYCKHCGSSYTEIKELEKWKTLYFLPLLSLEYFFFSLFVCIFSFLG